jgi:hypothetical protein
MMWWIAAAFADAGQVTCVFAGLPVEVRWTAAGELSAWDGQDRLLNVDVGPLEGVTVARCRDEGVRLTTDLREGGLALATVDVDFGATFDTMPGRFEPLRVQTLAGVRAASEEDFEGVRAALSAGADPAAVVGAVIAAAKGSADELQVARDALPGQAALDDALNRARIAEGRLDEARAELAPDSVMAGEVLWAEGRKRAARKVWTAAAGRGVVLGDEVRSRCPRCPP